MTTQNMIEEQKRQLHGIRIRDLLTTVTAASSAIAATGFLFSIAPLNGVLTFVLISYILFIVFFALITAIDDDREGVKDRVASVIIRSAAVIIFSALVFIVVFTISRGFEALPYLNFFTEDMSLAGPLDPLSSGGILHSIVGSLIQIAIALAITIPLGLITAVFLNEIPGKYS
ncbi:MAG: phosphate transporter permease PstA, partial [Actinomycetota bacterium]